jgi:hypothetical protein
MQRVRAKVMLGILTEFLLPLYQYLLKQFGPVVETKVNS